MTELKDNSFDLLAKVKKVGFDDKGSQITLTVNEADYLDVVNQLVVTSGTNVMVKITPNQTELDTDEDEESDGQTALDVDGEK
ncbi:hypothetical protein N6G95_09590 [Pediococcus inopinatus]|uniref:hypothetical protein n=1 Tax=Pediococcus inopinatus TaxID=114090 RepID=UPI002B25B315|nr:hypothetical protein [Pediococcus inopinatus]WPC19455.1 hypothetical protein N6G95_09590 [Pediococcus inopinatus]